MQKTTISYNCIFSVICLCHMLQLLKRERIFFPNNITNKMKPMNFLTRCIKSFVPYTLNWHRYLLKSFLRYCINFRYSYGSVLFFVSMCEYNDLGQEHWLQNLNTLLYLLHTLYITIYNIVILLNLKVKPIKDMEKYVISS